MAEVSINFLFLAPLFLTFLIAVLLYGLRKWLSNFSTELATANMIINVVFFAALHFKVNSSPTKMLYGFYNSTAGMGFDAATAVQLKANGFSSFFLLILNVVLTLLFVFETTKRKENREQTSYLIFLLFFSIGMNLSVIANDLFTIFLGWTIIGSSLLIMIASRQQKTALKQGAAQAYILIALALGFLLLAVVLSYNFLGTLNLDYLKSHPELLTELKARNGLFVIYLIIALFIIGFGLFANLFALNHWMPKVLSKSSASTQISSVGVTGGVALLAIVKVVYSIFSPTILTINDYTIIFLVVGLITAFEGVFLFLYQITKKNKTAETMAKIVLYTMITNLGIALTSLAAGFMVNSNTLEPTQLLQDCLGYAVLQIFNLFFGSYLALTALDHLKEKNATRTTTINFHGIGKEFPLTIFTFLVGLSSLIGLLPTFGGVNLYLLLFTLVKLEFVGTALALIVILLLMLSGFLLLLKETIFDKPSTESFAAPKGAIADLSFLNFVNLIVALGLVFLGLFPSFLNALVIENALALLP